MHERKSGRMAIGWQKMHDRKLEKNKLWHKRTAACGGGEWFLAGGGMLCAAGGGEFTAAGGGLGITVTGGGLLTSFGAGGGCNAVGVGGACCCAGGGEATTPGVEYFPVVVGLGGDSARLDSDVWPAAKPIRKATKSARKRDAVILCASRSHLQVVRW